MNNHSSNLLLKHITHYFPESPRKLAKSLEPKESNQGHLEVAPIEKKPSSRPSSSFVREEAPHTTRIPAPLWNKRRQHSRYPSDRDREYERSFRDRRRERDRVPERYSSREQMFGDRQGGSKNDNPHYLAYKQYVERRDSRSLGKCFTSCHKLAKYLTQNSAPAPRFITLLKWS